MSDSITQRNDEDLQPGSETTSMRSTWRSLGKSTTSRNAYLTVLNGEMIGRDYALGPGRLFVGRADDCDIVVKDNGVSRRHALIISKADGSIVVEDLCSTNGMTVNGEECSVRELAGGERIQFGSATVFKLEYRDEIEEDYASYLYESATQDRLTRVYNGRFLRDQLTSEFSWHRRHGLPLSAIFLDIDHFKSLNDKFGHLSGDEVLREVAQRCYRQTRQEDIFARFGGEEFACILRRTPLAAATAMAERMREEVARDPIRFKALDGTSVAEVTVSAGVAELISVMESPEELLAAADKRLYDAKSAGRNCVRPSPMLREQG